MSLQAHHDITNAQMRSPSYARCGSTPGTTVCDRRAGATCAKKRSVVRKPTAVGSEVQNLVQS